MKRILSLVAIAGLFTVTGCNKIQCWNCSCDMTQNTLSAWTSVDNNTGVTTTGSTESDDAATSTYNPACEGDDVALGSMGNHSIAAENMDGTHTYVDTNENTQDNGFSTITTVNTVTTTFTCACSEVD